MSFLGHASDLDRRRFLAGAAKTFLGVSLFPAQTLFQKGAAAQGLGLVQAEPASAAKALVPTARRVIYLYMSGGMSHLDTLDPKPGTDEQGPTKVIKTSADGVQIGEYLPKTAKQMHHAAIVRSLSSNQGAHEQGNYIMHTSYELRSTIRHPAMGAWLTKFQGKDNETLPGSVVIGNNSRHPGAGFFESRFSPLMINNPTAGLQNSKIARGLTEEKFERRLGLADALDQEFASTYDTKNVRAYSDMYRDAVRLMKSEDLKAFNINDEPEAMRELYGDDSFGQGCLLARRLAEHGVRFIEVGLGGWDTHSGNFVTLPEKCAILDKALAALLSDLDRRGMLEDTMVVLATEFGRTPNINQNEGRDHYPKAFSGLLAGGGIKGGLAYGSTDKTGAEVAENKVKVEDFNATIAYALGIPLDHRLFSPSGRPFTVVNKGKPVVDLFA